MTHKLLMRQLKRLGLCHEALPHSLANWEQLLQKVSKAYTEADQERYLLERSLHMSSNEMQERWQKVRALEEQWRSLSECAPDLILMVDLAGYVTFANRGRGVYTQAELVGKRLETFYMLPDNRSATAAFEQALAKKNAKVEIRGLGPNREELWFSQRMNPIEKDGIVTGVLVVETEITEQIKMQKQIEVERAKATHSAKFAILGEMAGGIAHEINTPLGTIQLLSSMLKELNGGEALDKVKIDMVADRIDATVGRISKIIRGLKTFARQSEGDPFVPATIASIVEEAMDLMGEKLKFQNIEMRIDSIPNELMIECRATQITQIIMNLCSNSVDALSDQKEKWIEIKARERDDFVDIVITDSGRGIPAAVREKIMQPFFTTKELGKGTGLGLSISKGIADQHHGQLYLDEGNKNTSFVLSLPRERKRMAG